MKIMKGLSASLLLAAGWLAAAAGPAMASSHREAPNILKLPTVDNTDVYAFRSYEPGRSDFVTLIANFIPLQDPFGGPNYFPLDENALYEIHIDNNGDSFEDISFQFRFSQTLRNIALPVGGKNVAIPLINAGPITEVEAATLNRLERYEMFVSRGARRRGNSESTQVANARQAGAMFVKPVDNIGNKSLPEYAAYAARHIGEFALAGCNANGKVFVGQRKEGFGVNLGELFDLVNIPAARVIGSRSGGTNATAGKNITTIAIEVPIACVTRGGEPVIGVWSTASIARNADGGITNSFTSSGGTGNPLGRSSAALNRAFIDGNVRQVSRLGMPLVNEVVIGLKDKDRFNESEPADDGQFLDYVTHPTLPALLEVLFGSAGVSAPKVFPRTDLVTVFLTGVPNVNQPRNVVPAEMIRLNTALPATPRGSQNSLGAALCFVDGQLRLSNPGCDPAGFPNGRRPGDDVVDITLRVAMGYLLPAGGNKPASASLPYTDGVLVEDSQFDNAFPYLRTPLPGSPNGANGLPPNPN
jgi:hypothetical protein